MLDNIEVQAKRGNEYSNLKNKKTIFQINSEITNEKQKEITFQRLSAEPNIKFTPSEIEAKIRLQDRLLDVYI